MDHSPVTVPGKIFLLGEYSILAGHPALIASVELYTDEAKLGFGSSTAKWVYDNSNSSMPVDTLQLWKDYCVAHPLASGGDVVAQNESFLGRGSIFEIRTLRDKQELHVQALPLNESILKSIYIFSASHDLNRKLRTDVALKSVPELSLLPKTQSLIERWKNARAIHEFTFLNDWVKLLSDLGLETEAAREDREMIQAQKGVVGVKGCGAGLNDVFLVATTEGPVQFEVTAQKISDERNLKFMGNLWGRLWKAK